MGVVSWNRSIPFVFLVAALALNARSDEFIMAAYELPSSAMSWFHTGAGQGFDDGKLYDNKRAQTFVPIRSGMAQSVEISAIRQPNTTAPLRIRITDTVAGVPNATLAVTYVATGDVPTYSSGQHPSWNVTGRFSTAALVLEAGQTYALVFDSATPEAGYEIAGCNLSPYPDGTMFRSQNSPAWSEESIGDQLFQITARARSELQMLDMPGNGSLQMTWTNQMEDIWVDQSTNMIDWTNIAGPLQDTSTWMKDMDESDKGFFRIREILQD